VQEYLLNIYGVLLFVSVGCNIMYIGYALTALFPVLQSLRDDIAFDAYEHLHRGYGGYELYLFDAGMHSLIAAFFIAAFLLYSYWSLVAMILLFFIIYG
jgi:hypothetical protein